MFYSLPKKIELSSSHAKWRIESNQSVLVVVGLTQLRASADFAASTLSTHVRMLLNKAKALDIPIIDLNPEQLMQSMVLLGEHVSQQKQIMIAGWISPIAKQVIQHISTISEQLCIINDAVLLDSQTQHIQWINRCAEQGLHHTNAASLNRLWALTAPREFILSDKGILFAIAEQLDMDVMEINPHQDLRQYGLDSVGMVSLIGLWRANGANISYEDVIGACTLEKLMMMLKYPNT